MKLALWQRLDVMARQMVPLMLTLGLVILAMLPYGIPGFAPVRPWLALIAVYYWSVHRPDLMPPAAVFAIGLFHDLLVGTNLGVGVLVLLLVHATVVSQRRFFRSQSFLVIWFGFVLVAMEAMSMVWLLHAILAGALVKPGPVAFQCLTTVAAYPLLAWLFARVQREALPAA